jgi:hemolysin activation/secretion protein
MTRLKRMLTARPISRWIGAVFALAPVLGLALAGLPVRAAADSHSAPHFRIASCTVQGKTGLSSEEQTAIFAPYLGTNVSLADLAQAASALQTACHNHGSGDVSVAIAPGQITNGIVVLHVFQAAIQQILISGARYLPSGVPAPARPEVVAVTVSNVAPTTAAAETNSATAATNTSPRIPGGVEAYEVEGNDLLSDDVIQAIASKYTGANVTFDDVGSLVRELVLEYRDRGYDTVNVSIPTQKMSNAVLKVQVFEGTLAAIRISGNRFYSSNNIMRALPGLKTNMLLNSKLFQAELDRANANRDRQIYPQIGEGPEVNTSVLDLTVKDRLPLRAKLELDNYNSPGTPDLRVNGSAEYDNLWQLEHSLGFQYSFSPEDYKSGKQWAFYDEPLVANYSAFYRLPLGTPGSIADTVASQPDSFGYSEATRKFSLPPPTGVPELNLYASRSTIDTGLEEGAIDTIFNEPGVQQILEQPVQEDLTVTEDIGFRLSGPVPGATPLTSTWSTGLDLKTFDTDITKTNQFLVLQTTVNAQGNPNPPTISTIDSPVPETLHFLQYLPYTLRYDGTLRDALGVTSFGLSGSVNTWYSGMVQDLQAITGSTKSHGHWVILNPSLSRDFNLFGDWTLSLRADGQWASEPLISNEQFGAGGVASVRGYHEGDVFGDTGWHVTAEQKTPPHVLGFINGEALSLRGSVFVDYAEVYLLDPQGAPGDTPLWSTGLSTAVALGLHWEGRLIFAVPLRPTASTSAYEPQFRFSLTGQF